MMFQAVPDSLDKPTEVAPVAAFLCLAVSYYPKEVINKQCTKA